MADDLQALEDWVEPLIQQLQPPQRRQLARTIARDLRRSQRERIKAQQNPDGSDYAPRKPQRWKQGAIRRKAMFTKLRTAKYLKARGTPDTATVGFSGRAAYIARVHQFGRTTRVDENGPRYDYPARKLLGFAGEREQIADTILDHLTNNTR